MFLKTNKVKLLAIYTASLIKDEYDFIQDKLNKVRIVYVIPYNEELPNFLSEREEVIKEKRSDTLFGYERLIQQLVNISKEPSENIVIISKDIEHLKRALPLPIGTVLISNGDIKYEDIGFLPDLKLNNFSELEGINSRLGYFSEVCSTIVSPNSSFNSTGFIFPFEMQRDKYKFNVMAGGRYFKPNHNNYTVHQLSHRIRKSKIDTSQNKLFEDLFVPMVNLIKETSQIHGITRVPNRPSKIDRLKPIVSAISKSTGIHDYTSELTCQVDYPPHKGLSSNMRFENVKGQFSFQGDLTEKHIVIIDDIFTTGATVYECAKELYQQGAKKVTTVVLGVNQFSNEFANTAAKCLKCDGNLQLRINSKNNTAFFGCENYFNDERRCTNGENFKDGWKRIKEVNSFKPSISEDSEVDWIF